MGRQGLPGWPWVPPQPLGPCACRGSALGPPGRAGPGVAIGALWCGDAARPRVHWDATGAAHLRAAVGTRPRGPPPRLASPQVALRPRTPATHNPAIPARALLPRETDIRGLGALATEVQKQLKGAIGLPNTFGTKLRGGEQWPKFGPLTSGPSPLCIRSPMYSGRRYSN